MKTREIQIKSCFGCPFLVLVHSPSQYKKISGTYIHHCKHYARDLSDTSKKPDFCKIEKISITEKD